MDVFVFACKFFDGKNIFIQKYLIASDEVHESVGNESFRRF